MTKIVLVIAGSDSGGGAGIQADIKTISAFGAYATTAITAITAQNTLGVQAAEMLTPGLVRAQISAVLDDLGADAIKTGMLGTAEMIRMVAHALAGTTAPLVLDPVMVAKGGHALLDPDAVATLRTLLMPRAAVMTPNIPEAEALTGQAITDDATMRAAGHALLAQGARAVLIKGGHLDGDMLTDWLMTPEGETAFSQPRIRTRHTHGTGCTLASAIAACLAQGITLPAAVARATAYVQRAIAAAPGLGQGHGPLNHAVASN